MANKQMDWTWAPSDPAATSELAAACAVPCVIAQILRNRGVETAAQANRFLHPTLEGLHDPFELCGMSVALERVSQAIDGGERIAVYGDFDVDGTVSTTLMMMLFRMLSVPAQYYIPSRLSEGYGLNKGAVDKLRADGVSLVITVDNGITAVEEVEYAQAHGVDVVITDHHMPAARLPPARAIVNPKQPGCCYPEKGLAGVGVAFKLAWAIAQKYVGTSRVSSEIDTFLETAIGMAAIATVADVVPLLGENRVLASYGLQALPRSPNPGIRALLDVCNLADMPLDASHIAFRLAPRLNAGGRLGNEDLGIRMLLAESYQEALCLAHEMEDENTQRQQIERAITQEARERVIAEIDLEATSIIVLCADDWHPGVIGIVASRMAEEFFRPTIVIAMRGETGRGSARSVDCFSIHDALSQCEDLLVTFGGHAFAAGLEVHRDNVDALRTRLNEVALAKIDPTTMRRCLEIDAELALRQITPSLLEQIDALSPFGEGNPQPVFATPDVELVGRPRLVGRQSQHLSFLVREVGQPGGQAVRVIGFNRAADHDLLVDLVGPFRLAYQPRLRQQTSPPEIELVLKDIHV